MSNKGKEDKGKSPEKDTHSSKVGESDLNTPPHSFYEYQEKQRNIIVKRLLEQGFLQFQNRTQAYESTLKMVGRRFIDSCLLEGLPLSEFPRKIGEIVQLMNESIPCVAVTHEFAKYGLETVSCELNGPDTLHKNVHKFFKADNVPESARHWVGGFEKPNVDYNLKATLEEELNRISQFPKTRKERQESILEYHENVLRDMYENNDNIYPRNNCVDCFTDEKNLGTMICGHSMCCMGCPVSKFRRWTKDWCPLCDPPFSELM